MAHQARAYPGLRIFRTLLWEVQWLMVGAVVVCFQALAGVIVFLGKILYYSHGVSLKPGALLNGNWQNNVIVE